MQKKQSLMWGFRLALWSVVLMLAIVVGILIWDDHQNQPKPRYVDAVMVWGDAR